MHECGCCRTSGNIEGFSDQFSSTLGLQPGINVFYSFRASFWYKFHEFLLKMSEISSLEIFPETGDTDSGWRLPGEEEEYFVNFDRIYLTTTNGVRYL